jgi:hypothetical protein
VTLNVRIWPVARMQAQVDEVDCLRRHHPGNPGRRRAPFAEPHGAAAALSLVVLFWVLYTDFGTVRLVNLSTSCLFSPFGLFVGGIVSHGSGVPSLASIVALSRQCVRTARRRHYQH